MKYLINNLRFPVTPSYDLAERLSAKLGLSASGFHIHRIARKAVDTRKRSQPFYDFSLEVEFDGSAPIHPDIHELRPGKGSDIKIRRLRQSDPFIIGMGPAGLFCALAMVENGLKPVLIDRGDPLELRAQKVAEYWKNGDLDPESNVQFGEGGAGAWSDGKLTSRSKDPLSERVFEIMIASGAPAEIAFEALPHLGTDGIRALVKTIREKLLKAGCEFHYRTRLEDISLQAGKLQSIKLNGQWHPTQVLIVAPGNASRDSFRMLNARGVRMDPKPFAAGFRIEQPQELIDRAVYGDAKWRELLGPATYRLTDKATGCYSFCMCPGGAVVASASETGTIVTNGMSYAARDGARCNSAIVCGVDEKTYGTGLFAGMEWQRQVETLACKHGALAPAVKAVDFLRSKISSNSLESSYLPGIRTADLATVLPKDLLGRLRGGLTGFDRILRGFYRDAVLIAPETRTSSPLRFLREPDSQACLNLPDIYVIGEGSGYAGGIVSSAIDGFRLGSSLKPLKD